MDEFTEIKLVVQNCYSCGIGFAVPDRYLKNRREDGVTFYCPNHHTLAYPKKDEDGGTNKDKIIRLEEENAIFKNKNIRLMAQLDQAQAQLAEKQPDTDSSETEDA